ncbi:MAG: beta-ketoacyl-[acyl-carrier-protein] synthase family protein [Acidimicrobiales bacterium]
MRISWDPLDPHGGIRSKRRVAVVGLGVVSCLGTSKEDFWGGLLGPSPTGIRAATNFDPSPWLTPKELRRYDRYNQFGVAAADLALQDAGTIEVDPARAGVWMGTGVGGLESLEAQVIVAHERGPSRVTPFLVPLMMANAGAASIAMRFGYQGPCETTVTACAASNQAIANAARLIANGRCDVMLTGGAEAAITPAATAGFNNMTALSASYTSRPFDKNRDGFVPGEGSGVLVLEELEHAKARGAHIYAIIEGTGSNEDAHHITAPLPGGVGAARCMRLALDDADLEPDAITHINAHGTSTPLNDLAESQAIISVFGDRRLPTTSVKGTLGHGLGAAGALEAVAACLTMETRTIPITANTKEIDPDIHIDVVINEPRTMEPGYILSNSFGFGGHNSCVIFGPPDR